MDTQTQHLTRESTLEKMPRALVPGDALVGSDGGTSRVVGPVQPSGSLYGMVVVETEHGGLYLDGDLAVDVLIERV